LFLVVNKENSKAAGLKWGDPKNGFSENPFPTLKQAGIDKNQIKPSSDGEDF
jgi:hypothetical protein